MVMAETIIFLRDEGDDLGGLVQEHSGHGRAIRVESASVRLESFGVHLKAHQAASDLIIPWNRIKLIRRVPGGE
jgi:hypothetical protein